METLKAFTAKEHLERQETIREALTWLGTPFMHEARVKGAGCDCGRFLIACYSVAGVVPDYEPPAIAEQWHLHKDAVNFDPEFYLREIQKLAREILEPPDPGDLALFWWGHAYSHSAIVISWPTQLVHCFFVRGVQLVDASIDPYLRRFVDTHSPRFFTPWDKEFREPFVPIPETAQ